MLNIVIADDELKICDLIFNLVDWKTFDMQVVGVAHDGIEIQKMIDSTNPDIVITDIRMPGCNGIDIVRRTKEKHPNIEFIIISGYSEFEYAKNAIHYGVSDYLLKPLNKKEFEHALEKLKSKIQKQVYLTDYSHKMAVKLQKNQKKLREQFLQDLYNHSSDLRVWNIEQINLEYGLHLKTGRFQVLTVKADGLNFKDDTESSFLFEKISQTFYFMFFKKVYDSCNISLKNGYFVFFLNYNPEDSDSIESTYRQFLTRILIQKDVLRGVHITIGLGRGTERIRNLEKELESSVYAVKNRLVLGLDQVIFGEERKRTTEYKDYFMGLIPEFENAIELLDGQRIASLVRKFGNCMEQDPTINGNEVLQLSKALLNVYLIEMQKNDYHSNDLDGLLERFSDLSEQCLSIQSLVVTLGKIIIRSVSSYKEQRKEDGRKPIREAKEYIMLNLSGSVSLEEVCGIVGYNSTYFSVLFKKECGMNFSEYVMRARIEKAKKLLKSTNETVATIMSMVGYTDIKTFNRNFNKIVGVNPGQYRKLYG